MPELALDMEMLSFGRHFTKACHRAQDEFYYSNVVILVSETFFEKLSKEAFYDKASNTYSHANVYIIPNLDKNFYVYAAKLS